MLGRQGFRLVPLLCLVLLGFAFCEISYGADPAYQSGYNEVFDPRGNMRPAYRRFEQRTGLSVMAPASSLVQALSIKHPLQDKIKVLPVPLILSRTDNIRIREGVTQRALAMAAFFEDVLLGEGRIYSIIDKDELHGLMLDSGWNIAELRSYWRGKTLGHLSFQFGPDLWRIDAENWGVYEDNVGFLGGLVDYTHIRNAFIDHAGLDPALKDDPGFFYLSLDDFFQQANADPARGEVVAFLSGIEDLKKLRAHEKHHHDLERIRLADLLESRGIAIWEPSRLGSKQNSLLRSGKIKAVVNLSMPNDFVQRETLWRELFGERGIYFSEAPGVRLFANKGFLGYVPKWIEFYLGEKPILQTPATKVLPWGSAGPDKLDPAKVYKLASGARGDQVHIAHRMSASEQAESVFVRAQFSSRIRLWIEQDYGEPSFIPAGKDSWHSYILDVRPITTFHGGFMRTMPTPWARASSSLGEGKNNVSRGAFEVVTLEQDCDALLADGAP